MITYDPLPIQTAEWWQGYLPCGCYAMGDCIDISTWEDTPYTKRYMEYDVAIPCALHAKCKYRPVGDHTRKDERIRQNTLLCDLCERNNLECTATGVLHCPTCGYHPTSVISRRRREP